MNKKTTQVIRLLALLLVLTFCCGTLFGCSNAEPIEPLNTEEEYVKTALSSYRTLLKDPDSMKIRGDIGYIKFENGYNYIVASIAGNNSYGASTTSTPIWIKGSYFDTCEHIAERSDEITNMDTSGLTKDEKIDLLTENILINFIHNTIRDYYSKGTAMIGNTYGTGSGDSKVSDVKKFSGKRIANALGCEYSEY